MKNLLFLFLLFTILSSCDSNDSLDNGTDPDEFIGEWFRSEPVRVWQGHDVPSIEKGDRQYLMSILDDGTFLYNITTFGVYDGTSIDDLNSFRTDKGSHEIDGNKINITLDEYEWFDTWHEDMEEPETIQYVNTNPFYDKFIDATLQLDGNKLIFKYSRNTDIIDPDSETPGVDKFVEEYLRN